MSNPRLEEIYRLMFDRFGPQRWWPGDSRIEIMVGAVLTQNTNWSNVEKAINNLKAAGILDLEGLEQTPAPMLAELIRPSGYYNIKAGRLKNLIHYIVRQHGDLDTFFSLDTTDLREELISVKGIGPETCDSILLYAADRPVFVIDAYTHRMLSRHQLIWEEDGYYEMQELFTGNLNADRRLFNEYHALIVRLGKDFCRKKKPACEKCPLRADLEEYGIELNREKF